jgi:hypothetical protein
VLLCFQSRDHQVSLELVVHRTITKTKDVARAGVQDTMKHVAV